MARVCIICEKEVEGGFLVEEDIVIRAIRSAKQRLNIAKNNTLVVSEECLDSYKKKREKYERELAFHIVIGGILLLILTVPPILTSGFNILSFFAGLVLAGLVIILPVFSHCPKISREASESASGKKAGQVPVESGAKARSGEPKEKEQGAGLAPEVKKKGRKKKE